MQTIHLIINFGINSKMNGKGYLKVIQTIRGYPNLMIIMTLIRNIHLLKKILCLMFQTR